MKRCVYNGIDRPDVYARLLKGKKLALLTSASGVNKSGVPTYEILAEKYHLDLLLAPEHGLHSNLQDGKWSEETRDSVTGARLVTLDRNTRERLTEFLRDIDTVVYDIQDVGARFYTYLYNLTDVMIAARAVGTSVVVLDRINPIGGTKLEGEILDEEKFSSGIGRYATPTRYGLTIGELASYLNDKKDIHCDLTVVPCEGWSRNLYGDETDLLFVNPSPNIPSVNCAINYIGNCIWEATNISEGRGTTRPFDLVGAPFVDAGRLCREITALHLPGVVFRRAYFTPMFNKYAGETCEGVELHITDRDAYSPFLCMLHLYEHMRRYPDFSARNEGICLRFGTDRLLHPMDIPAFIHENTAKIDAFKKSVRPYLLYGTDFL